MARLKLFTAWFGWERSNWAEPSIRWASKLFGSMVIGILERLDGVVDLPTLDVDRAPDQRDVDRARPELPGAVEVRQRGLGAP